MPAFSEEKSQRKGAKDAKERKEIRQKSEYENVPAGSETSAVVACPFPSGIFFSGFLCVLSFLLCALCVNAFDL
jgi:hypothetical protein